jgi:hypothetical protein
LLTRDFKEMAKIVTKLIHDLNLDR